MSVLSTEAHRWHGISGTQKRLVSLAFPFQEEELRKAVKSIIGQLHAYQQEDFAAFEQLFAHILGVLDKSMNLTKMLLSPAQ